MSAMRLQDLKIVRILVGVLKKLWAISSATALACLILYWFYGGLLAFLLLLFAITGILYHAEDQLIYHPDMPSHSRVFVPLPSMFGLPYESISYKAGDGTALHMFFIRHPGEKGLHAPTIVFFHGNAGNMGHRLTYISGFYKALNYNVLLLEYRGYGLSGGCPSEEGLCMDARAALDYLYTRHDINHSKIILFGRSLGGAVAIDLATNVEYSTRIWCLIVENTFTSIPEMAKVLLIWKPIEYLPLCFYKNQFMSLHKIPCMTVPTMFISGQADTLVPPSMMTLLHSRCGSELKYLHKIEGGTHNETWTKKGYYQAIASFVETVAAQGTLTQPPMKHNIDVHRVILDV